MQSTPDEVLIGRIANGDRLAMQVLYARYHVRVFRFVVRLVRDEATAEDMISEVFLDLWRQAGRFEGRSTVSTWLLAIAAPTPLPKSRLISPIFTADSVSLHVSPEKDGKSDLVYARIGRCQGRPAWRGACAAVPRRYV